ncbi:hypothetical protein GCM10011575_42050 [Microlunatus endophyticus]|uniref:Peptidase inhibitor family I36 n=1 Tax=Microlunatus endophyticus TaxID=1716077 RepID=A0A917W8L8_9ACTN|nr:hypothetical protein [Microlunatus endophyticus]GGL79237.1 hypothetical protein GCM10011575_42050 [Microlunatus endophyticus]
MKIRTLAKGALAASVLAVGATTLAVTPAHAATGTPHTIHNCQAGYVCVYASKKAMDGGHPTYAFSSYAGHNIYGQTGTKYVLDNQTGSHSLGLCAKAGGKGGLAHTGGIQAEGSTEWDHYTFTTNFTPVYSLDLRTFGGYSKLCDR